jgi:hypothetical protein
MKRKVLPEVGVGYPLSQDALGRVMDKIMSEPRRKRAAEAFGTLLDEVGTVPVSKTGSVAKSISLLRDLTGPKAKARKSVPAKGKRAAKKSAKTRAARKR